MLAYNTQSLFHQALMSWKPWKCKHVHRGSALGGRVTHDDALGNTRDAIRLSERRRIEQMVRGLLEGRKHQHAVLHLCYTEPSNAQYFSLQILSAINHWDAEGR